MNSPLHYSPPPFSLRNKTTKDATATQFTQPLHILRCPLHTALHCTALSLRRTGGRNLAASSEDLSSRSRHHHFSLITSWPGLVWSILSVCLSACQPVSHTIRILGSPTTNIASFLSVTSPFPPLVSLIVHLSPPSSSYYSLSSLLLLPLIRNPFISFPQFISPTPWSFVPPGFDKDKRKSRIVSSARSALHLLL